MIPCGRRSTSDASSSFFVAGAILCRPQEKVPETTAGKKSFLTFSMLIFRGAQLFC